MELQKQADDLNMTCITRPCQSCGAKNVCHIRVGTGRQQKADDVHMACLACLPESCATVSTGHQQLVDDARMTHRRCRMQGAATIVACCWPRPEAPSGSRHDLQKMPTRLRGLVSQVRIAALVRHLLKFHNAAIPSCGYYLLGLKAASSFGCR